MKRILIINGPNLNLLGTREPGIYGSQTMDSVITGLRQRYPDIELLYYQSNHEGDLIDRIHAADKEEISGIVLNAGAYTHTSLAIADAIAAVGVSVVEVHISNISSREPIRHNSMITPVCRGIIAGFGTDSYRLAIESLL